MFAIAIILSVLLLLAFIRVGVIIEYNGTGVAVWLKIGFLRLRIAHKDGYKSRTGNFLRKRIPGSISPGNARDFIIDMLSIIKDMMGRLKRRLLIKKLVIYYISASNNPAATALQFGTANAIYGIVVPVLDRHFRIKQRDIRTTADFESKKNGIYLLLDISIAVWETIYVSAVVLPMFKSMNTDNNIKTDKMKDEGGINGERTD